jgi:secretion/DNA translocation related TadE-like protein
MRDERGSGAVLALAIVGAAILVAVAVLGLGSALVLRQRTIGAADAAAVGAADGASGAIAVEPCRAAAQAAAANHATLVACRLDGLVATVEVSARFGVTVFTARSSAGPPP